MKTMKLNWYTSHDRNWYTFKRPLTNSASESGGGIYCYLSSPSMRNITMSENNAKEGGGLYCYYYSHPKLENVILNQNTSKFGGAILSRYHSNPHLQNVTIYGNSGMIGSGFFCEYSSHVTLVNSILWNNWLEVIHCSGNDLPNSITITYSNIQDGEESIVTNNNCIVNWLEGNVDADPLFVDPENGDYTLQEGSPCIDAGTSFFVWEGDTLVNLPKSAYKGDAPDMGAFESPYSLAIEEDAIIPIQYTLSQPRPNPFNPQTTIDFSIPQSEIVTLNVYDIIGREVETILNKQTDAGHHRMQWNASNVPSGIYLIRMQSGNFSQVRKVMAVQ